MDSSNSESNKDVSFLSDFDQLFATGSLPDESGEVSPIGACAHHAQSPQSWRKKLWSLQQDPVSPTVQMPGSSHGTIPPSAISNSTLNSVNSSTEALLLPSVSPTPPTTPRRKSSKSTVVTPKSICRRESNDPRASLRKRSFSPSLLRSSHYQKNKMAFQEAWAQRLQYQSLQSDDSRLPISPPPSDILIQQENLRRDSGVQIALANNDPSSDGYLRSTADLSSGHPQQLHLVQQPSSNPLTAKPRYLSHSNFPAVTTMSPSPVDALFHSPHSAESQQMPFWHVDALGSVSGASYSPDFAGHDGASWWSSLPARVSHAPNSHSLQEMTMPLNQEAIHSHAQHDELLQGGLMIRFDSPSFDVGSGAESSLHSSGQHSRAVTSGNHALPPKSSHTFLHQSPYVVNSANSQMMHPSRSPSLSSSSVSSKPVAIPPANSKMHHRRTHSRKLSSQSTSMPKLGNRPSGSPKAVAKPACMSFVNFTPDDSQKILTGVAPSGSSKTKARREQEARDKRRKLSEAALMAVRQAGGDVEALEAVLC